MPLFYMLKYYRKIYIIGIQFITKNDLYVNFKIFMPRLISQWKVL